MKITMYELLGMIKDSKAPKKIKYNGIIYKRYKEGYIRDDLTRMFPHIDFDMLNDKVEVIEEEKKIPEKLPIYDCTDTYDKFDINDNRKVINEIIDYLKSKGE